MKHNGLLSAKYKQKTDYQGITLALFFHALPIFCKPAPALAVVRSRRPRWLSNEVYRSPVAEPVEARWLSNEVYRSPVAEPVEVRWLSNEVYRSPVAEPVEARWLSDEVYRSPGTGLFIINIGCFFRLLYFRLYTE